MYAKSKPNSSLIWRPNTIQQLTKDLTRKVKKDKIMFVLALKHQKAHLNETNSLSFKWINHVNSCQKYTRYRRSNRSIKPHIICCIFPCYAAYGMRFPAESDIISLLFAWLKISSLGIVYQNLIFSTKQKAEKLYLILKEKRIPGKAHMRHNKEICNIWYAVYNIPYISPAF